VCDAESAASNTRIMRTTRKWLLDNPTAYRDMLMVIQWSTWEREEWLHNGSYLQVGASGTDHVPAELQTRYKEFVANTDWSNKTQQAHEDIWQLHEELLQKNIKHIFFNGNNDFAKILDQKDWGTSYIGPYDPRMTYDAIIRAQGIDTVAPNSWHFGRDGHSYFHRFMLQYIIANKFI
jgi:hypothetical protein